MFPESAEVSETSAAVGALEGLLTRVGPVMTLRGKGHINLTITIPYVNNGHPLYSLLWLSLILMS